VLWRGKAKNSLAHDTGGRNKWGTTNFLGKSRLGVNEGAARALSEVRRKKTTLLPANRFWGAKGVQEIGCGSKSQTPTRRKSRRGGEQLFEKDGGAPPRKMRIESESGEGCPKVE